MNIDFFNLSFHKSMGTFDRLEVTKDSGNELAHIIMHVGNDVETVTITLRSRETIEDLRYALNRLLAQSAVGG